MQSASLQILQNNITPEKDLQSLAGKGKCNQNIDFESVFQSTLDSEKTDESYSQNFRTGNIASKNNAFFTLKAILQKLSNALHENFQTVDLSHLKSFLETTLQEEEIQFIKFFLQNRKIFEYEDNGRVLEILTNEFGENALENLKTILNMIKETVYTLNCMIEQNGDDHNPGINQNLDINQPISEEPGSLRDPLLLIAGLSDRFQQLHAQWESLYQNIQGLDKSILVINGKASPLTENTGVDDLKQNLLSGLFSVPEDKVVLESSNMFLGSINPLGKLKQILQANACSGETSWDTKQADDPLVFLKNLNPDGSQKESSSFDTKSFLFNQQLQNKASINFSNQMVNNPPATVRFLSNLLQLSNLSTQNADTTISSNNEQSPLSEHLNHRDDLLIKGNQSSLFTRSFAVIENPQQAMNQTDNVELGNKTLIKDLINPSSVIHEITDRINMGVKRGEFRLALQIHPPSLGKVHVELSMKDNQLRAMIMAESTQAKQLLDANIDQLKTCLENQNIEIEKISVHVSPENKQFASFLKEQKNRGKKSMMEGPSAEKIVIDEQEGVVNSLHPMNVIDAGGYTLDLFV